MSDVEVQVTEGAVTVNLGTTGAVSGATSLTTLNALTKVAGTGEIAPSLILVGTIVGAMTFEKTGTTARAITFPDAAITVARSDAAQTLTGTQTIQAAATQDAIALAGRAGGTGSYAATLTPATLSASVTLTLPALTGTLATLDNAQTWTAAQTFRAANAIRSEAAATQDAVVIAGRAGGTGSYAVTLTPATLSANVTLTLPATTATLAVTSTNTWTGIQTHEDNLVFSVAKAASTTAGTLQRETNQDAAYEFNNGIGGWIDKCIFSQYATVTHSGAVTAQSLASATARGTRTLPANFFKQGKVLKFRLCGVYTTDVAAGNATIAIKIGSTTFRTTASFALDASITDGYWTIDGEITCYTTGATGTVAGQTAWLHRQTGATGQALHAEEMTTTGAVTIDTTAAGAFDVVWTADDAGTAITCSCFRLWEVC